MDERYEPAAVEQLAQQHWNENRSFVARENFSGQSLDAEAQLSKGKFYCLSMFPYPSGRLHMGHVRNYTIGDVLSRFARMQGRNVLQPMGWDAFGLPAENAAIANGVAPAKWTRENIAYMKKQLQALGLAIDWEREIATCDPSYYRWNQWLFLRMREKGIAYKKTGIVNWDPLDQTVLANEQVIDGRGWRTGVLIEKREIPMYYLNITAYGDELLGDLASLEGWPERVKLMQANWIGRSTGCEVNFPYAPQTRELMGKDATLKVFTTRVDTLYGATFLAIAAEHPLALAASTLDDGLKTFIDECRRGSTMEADVATMEKKGRPTGYHVTHPFTGKLMQVWVANYVLMGYGEGAVMGVPAHDERDFAFARKNNIKIISVVRPLQGNYEKGSPDAINAEWCDTYGEHGITFNSGEFSGLAFEAAMEAISIALEQRNLGRKRVQFRLRDWGISRQRYWGCPIPLIHCEHCGEVPVPEIQLPVVLPEDLVPDGSGNPLNKTPSFWQVPCPTCGKSARRETDTMDTFVDSSWYFLRFPCANNLSAMVDDRVNYWLPVDQYIGGIEHAILHLLYSRFWTKVMRDLDLVTVNEPFSKLLTQGMVLNHIYSQQPSEGRRAYFNPLDITEEQLDGQKNYFAKGLGGEPFRVSYDGLGTMSKSKNNGVDPQILVEKYGADTARLFMMFTAPPEQSLEWSDEGVQGAYRFIRRLWKVVYEHVSLGVISAHIHNHTGSLSTAQQNLRRTTHQTLTRVTDDIGRRRTFNTAISAVMELLNAVIKFDDRSPQGRAVTQEALEIATLSLSPIIPHVCHTLWYSLGHSTHLIDMPWPKIDNAALIQDSITLMVQVNGRLRGQITVASDADEATVRATALAEPSVCKFFSTALVKKVIVVPRKLVNVVV
ncbi:MAG: leucine--tRNA ligase [Gammaproteobacteria bacterium]|nr:leucine--tRNA ligase [Gammaproteobacteria bacterium]